jgi:hypothetical protein
MGLSFDEVQDLVLYVFYRAVIEGIPKKEGGEVLGIKFPKISIKGINERMIEKAIDALAHRKLLNADTFRLYVDISGKGMIHIDERLRHYGTFLNTISPTIELDRLEDDWGNWEAVDVSFTQGIPASNRTVSIDHNAKEALETIQTLRTVVEEAEKSNEFAELFADPDEKVIVISEMEAGIGLLSGPKVYVETIRSLLVSKLQWIKEKLPDWSASALVSKGLDLLLKLLGIS